MLKMLTPGEEAAKSGRHAHPATRTARLPGLARPVPAVRECQRQSGKPMRGLQRTNRGFTLTELMVTLLIFIIFVAMGVPSFMAQRQRAALRGVADQTLGFWNAARFEAVKRNTLVKVGVVSNSSGFCLGATTDTPTDGIPCDCMDATACNVARFPGNQA